MKELAPPSNRVMTVADVRASSTRDPRADYLALAILILVGLAALSRGTLVALVEIAVYLVRSRAG